MNITTAERDFEGDYPSISYTIEGADKAGAKVSAMVDNSWKIISVTDTEVKVKAVDGTSANLLLFLIDKNNQTYTYTLQLSFKAKTITPNDDTQTLNKGEYLIKGDGTETHGQIIIKDDAVVTLSNVNIKMNTEEAPIKIEQGTPVILLTGTNKLTGGKNNGGILLANENANIIIDGEGSLIVKGGNDDMPGGAAGIGSSRYGGRCGNITILGGTLDIEGCAGGAGIGSGSWMSNCGDIIISGGTITAKSGEGWNENYNAIGTGRNSSCRSIILSGCTLYLYKSSDGTGYIRASTVTPDPDNAAELTAANVKLYKDGTLFN